jgi:hypothetical protein
MQSLANTLQPVYNLGIATATIRSKIASDVHIIGTHLFGKRKNDVNGITMAIDQGPTHRVIKSV